MLLLAFCAIVVLGCRNGTDGAASHKEDIRAIHEREVQKAIKELSAEKAARRDAERRKELLNQRRAAQSSLEGQLRNVNRQKAAALAELDDIRRLHLFRSRSKKERQMAEQLSLIESLEAKAEGIRGKMRACQASIDSIANGITQ